MYQHHIQLLCIALLACLGTSMHAKTPTATAAVAKSKPAAAVGQSLIAAQSSIRFSATQMGVPIEGQFSQFDAQIAFNTASPALSRIRLNVDTASATFGAPQYDAELRRPKWFDTVQFPHAVFESTTVRKTGPTQYAIGGTLTIKGKTQTITIPVQLTQSKNLTTAVGSFTLARLYYQIGSGEWADTSVVADPVTIHFKMVLTGL